MNTLYREANVLAMNTLYREANVLAMNTLYREANVSSHERAVSPFLIGRMFLREPSWKYSANLFGS